MSKGYLTTLLHIKIMRLSVQDNSKLYLNLLDLELSGDLRLNGGGVQQCVSKALAAPLSSDLKILFSQRGLQFAEDFGTTVQRSGVTRDKITVIKDFIHLNRPAVDFGVN